MPLYDANYNPAIIPVTGKYRLQDLDPTGASNGDVVTFNAGTGQAEWATGGSGGETVVKIGEIDFNDLNVSSAATFTDAKPEGKYFKGAFLRTTETFVSYSGSVIYALGQGLNNTWVTVSQSSYPGINTLNAAGKTLASAQLSTELASADDYSGGISVFPKQDIVVQLGLSNDSQDWSAGKMEVWCVFGDFPTFS